MSSLIKIGSVVTEIFYGSKSGFVHYILWWFGQWLIQSPESPYGRDTDVRQVRSYIRHLTFDIQKICPN